MNEGVGFFLNFTIEFKKKLAPPTCKESCGVVFSNSPCAWYAPLETKTNCLAAAQQSATLLDGPDFRVSRSVVTGSAMYLDGFGRLVIPMSDCKLKIAQKAQPFKDMNWSAGRQEWIESPFPATFQPPGCAFIDLKFKDISEHWESLKSPSY